MLKLRGRRHTVLALAFSANNRWLAAGGGYGSRVHVWDSLTGTVVNQLKVDLRYRMLIQPQLFFTPDDQVLVPTVDGWHFCDPQKNTSIKHKDRPTGWVVLSPNGRYLCVSGEDSAMRMFDVARCHSTLRWTVKAEKKVRIYADLPAFSADSERFATIERPNWTVEKEQTLVIRRTDDGKRELTLPCPNVRILSLYFAADGRHVAGMAGRSVLWWDLQDPQKKPEKMTNESKRYLAGLAVHPDSERFATIDNDRHVRIWDRRTATVINTLEWDIGKLYAIAFSPDGCRAAIGSSRGTVLLWDVE